MHDFFHAGLGWWLAKQYFRLTAPLAYPRATGRVARYRKQRRPERSEDLDRVFPDRRQELERPIEQVRAVSLRIVDMLLHLGDRHGFTFQIAYGTLLGGIRHGGFIPWDDDIDVLMTEADFDRFLAVAHELPDSITLYQNNHEFWKVMDRYSHVSDGGLGGIAVDIFLLKAAGPEHYRFLNVHGYRYKTLPARDLFPLSLIEFEGASRPLPAPADPDAVLTAIYGDWRKLPPEEQRVYPHLDADLRINSHGEEALHPHPY